MFFNLLRKVFLKFLPKRFHLSGVSYPELHCCLDKLSISKSKKQILLYLKMNAGIFDVAQISLKRIKKGTLYSGRTIYLAIRFWESSEIVEVIQRKDRRGAIITNRYILHLERLKDYS